MPPARAAMRAVRARRGREYRDRAVGWANPDFSH